MSKRENTKKDNVEKARKSANTTDGLAGIVAFDEILKIKMLRVTDERKALYSHLSGLEAPISIKQLAASLSSKMDQATVYRNIEVFEEIGVINKIYTGWKYRIELSERFRPHHHHMTCENCGKIIPISLGEKMEQAIENFGRKHGFKIKSHEIELRGLCKDCY